MSAPQSLFPFAPLTIDEFVDVFDALFTATGWGWGMDGREKPTKDEIRETLTDLYNRVPADLATAWQTGTGRIELQAESGEDGLYRGDVRVFFDLGELPRPTPVSE